MAVGLAVSQANAILDTLVTGGFWVQLHVGDPGAAGTANIAGNATRKLPTFPSAAGGQKSNDAVVSWSAGEVDTSEDYTHWSAWTASSGGTFKCSGLMTANAVVVGDTYSIPIGEQVLTIGIATA
jgi:hypothetical protein